MPSTIALLLAASLTSAMCLSCDRAWHDAKASVPVVAAVGIAQAASTASTQAASLAAEPTVPDSCPETSEAALLVSPRVPHEQASLRILAVSRHAREGRLAIRGPRGPEVVLSRGDGEGPPAWWYGESVAPVAGTYRVVLGYGNTTLACQEIKVTSANEVELESRRYGPVWQAKHAWSQAFEDLYSAWIERLFDDPLTEQPSWPALHKVLRDEKRNLLHNYLGEGEDEEAPVGWILDPDCADLPYFLRAYFAFKMSLPFGFSSCTRGVGGVPPQCLRYRSNVTVPLGRHRTVVGSFGDFLRVHVADTVHSGSARIPSETDDSDYYSVPLSAESLRPGTIYADPYGHVLVIVKRIAQTETSGGVLLAVDGQPDGTVARRRYWRGNFLFGLDHALGSPGFKRFRPVVQQGPLLRALTNDEIARNPDYADYSRDQYLRGVDGFYDKMDDVLSPVPRDPTTAMLETIQALEEQVRGRVLSVKNGQAYMAAGNGSIDMPKGPAIFETVGPWEDFSTPSRDLRLLIAIDIVRDFPALVARRPSRFAMPAGGSKGDIRATLEETLKRELGSRKITYKRSDDSEFTLSLADVVNRAEALEMAYNPNDCVEVRWGAAADSEEMSTCKARASWAQQAKMRRYRVWFRERRRPARE